MKLLLFLGEKRLALLAEIQKLKSNSKEEKEGVQPCFGSLSIENIQLPLRTEYIFSMASKKDGGTCCGFKRDVWPKTIILKVQMTSNRICVCVVLVLLFDHASVIYFILVNEK